MNLTSLLRFHVIFAFSAVENAIYELRDLTIFFPLRILNGIIGLRKERRTWGKDSLFIEQISIYSLSPSSALLLSIPIVFQPRYQ